MINLKRGVASGSTAWVNKGGDTPIGAYCVDSSE